MDITANNNTTTERQNAAAAETLLLREISKRQLHGYKFRRQTCTHSAAIDFVCAELKLVVELYSESDNEGTEHISVRTQRLEGKGFQLARFRHSEVLTNLGGVIDSLSVAIRQCKKSVEMSKMACRYLSGGMSKSFFSPRMST
jgi:very-short-patch-repair endonuclease